ncbi:MAG: hypothetical protein U0270_45850 [Labilithrix sp.]
MRLATLPAALLLGTLTLSVAAIAGCADDADPTTHVDPIEAVDDAKDREDIANMIEKDLDPDTAADANGAVPGDPGADFDQDGIPDALEEQLLRKYRPYYKFSKEGDKEEDNRPSDPVAEIENAQLKMISGDNDVSDPIAGCGRASDKHLVPAASLYECKPEASFLKAKAVSKYCLNIADARYAGVSAAEAKEKSTGFYGHVTKDKVNGHDAYRLEYWQFYAFNNQDITVLGMGSFGDHEGDWTGMELWYDLTTKSIVKLDYMIHGKEVFFNIPAGTKATCTSCFQTVKGAKYDPNVGSFHDDKERPKYNDNAAEFWNDETGTMHTVLYVERGGHEGWPGKWGKAEIDLGPVTIRNNAHNGEGASYLVNVPKDRPLNLGELDHPLTKSARMILEFNGHWGCTNTKDLFGQAPQRRSPVGPGMHCEWHMADGSKAVPGCEH